MVGGLSDRHRLCLPTKGNVGEWNVDVNAFVRMGGCNGGDVITIRNSSFVIIGLVDVVVAVLVDGGDGVAVENLILCRWCFLSEVF